MACGPFGRADLAPGRATHLGTGPGGFHHLLIVLLQREAPHGREVRKRLRMLVERSGREVGAEELCRIWGGEGGTALDSRGWGGGAARDIGRHGRSGAGHGAAREERRCT